MAEHEEVYIWPSKEDVVRRAVDAVLRRARPEITKALSQKAVKAVVKNCVPRGFRNSPKSWTASVLRDVLLRLSAEHPPLFRALVTLHLGAQQRFVGSLVETAYNWWPDAAYRRRTDFLAQRCRPTLHEWVLADWASPRALGVSARPLRSAWISEGRVLVGDGDQLDLDGLLAQRNETVLELVGFRPLESAKGAAEAIEAVQESRFADAAQLLREGAPIYSAMCALWAEDFEHVDECIARLDETEENGRAFALALRLGCAFVQEEFEACVELSTGVLFQAVETPELRDFPTWALIRGLSLFAVGRTSEAVAELTDPQAAVRGQSPLTLIAARQILERADADVPDRLRTASDQVAVSRLDFEAVAEGFRIDVAVEMVETVRARARPRPVFKASTSPKILTNFRSNLDALAKARERVFSATEVGDWATVRTVGEKADALQNDAAAQYLELCANQRHDLRPSTLSNLVADSESREEFFALWTTRNQAEAEKRFDEQASALLALFDQTDTEVPRDFHRIERMDELEAFASRHRRALERRLAVAELLEGRRSASWLSELDRDELSACSLEVAKQCPPELMLAFFHEVEIPIVSPELRDAVVTAAEHTLLARSSWPGMWGVVGRFLSADDLSGLLGRLPAEVSAQHILLEELVSVFDVEPNVFPPHLREAIALQADITKPAAERLPLLVSRLRTSADEYVAQHAFDSLIELRRYSDALYFAAVSASAYEMRFAQAGLIEALFRVMLQAAGRGDVASERPELESLLIYPEWLSPTPENSVTFLFLAAQLGADGAVDNFRYAERDAYAQCESVYPEITRHLEWAVSSGRAWSVLRSARRRAEALVSEFRHDLAKESCYPAWPPAKEYQKRFAPVLAADIERVLLGAAPEMVPDELIDEVRRTRGLTEVEGSAADAMLRYLVGQLTRLTGIRELAEFIDPLAPVSRLDLEVKRFASTSALARDVSKLLSDGGLQCDTT